MMFTPTHVATKFCMVWEFWDETIPVDVTSYKLEAGRPFTAVQRWSLGNGRDEAMAEIVTDKTRTTGMCGRIGSSRL